MENKDESKPIEQPPLTDKPKERGLNDRMGSIEEKLDLMIPKEKEKSKFFKMPWGFKSKQKKIEKSIEKIQVILVGTNGNIKPLVKEMNNGFIEHNGKYYDSSAGFVLRWMGKTPTFILLEWRLTPIGPKDYENAVEAKLGSIEAQKIIIRAMEVAKLEEKGTMNKMMFIYLGIAALIVAYVLFGRG